MSSTVLRDYFKELPSSTIVTFVKQQGEMSERMKIIHQEVKELTSAEIQRMSVEDVLNINNVILTKVPHVFILDSFTGSAYQHLVAKKCDNLRIFGVPLVEKIRDVAITEYWQIFSDSFQDIKVCTSNLNTAEKLKIEGLIKSMNGRFTNELSSDVTHLITNSTKTVKYYDAYTLDIPIYHTEWIYHIWNRWQKQHDLPKATSEQFDVFKLPPLFELKISITGMSKKRKDEISELIEENGGKFEEIFKSNEIDVLLMDQLDVENPKYRAAVKNKIPVLNTNWVTECVKAGYALSYKDFAFKRPKSRDSSSSSSLSALEISVTNVSSDDPPKTDEKVTIQEKSEDKPVPVEKTVDNFLLNFTIGQAKKIGHILDGYVLYFYNFPTDHYFKVGKLISTCGAIRITEIDQSITHVICFNNDNLDDFHKKTIDKGFHGSYIDYKWLIECLKQGELLSESDFTITVNAQNLKKLIPPSPLSRKAINSLNLAIKLSAQERKENANAPLHEISTKRESTSFKMLDFSEHELIQSSIEANHKKIKQPSSVICNRKRSHENDLCSTDETSKRRKLSDDDSQSFQNV